MLWKQDTIIKKYSKKKNTFQVNNENTNISIIVSKLHSIGHSSRVFVLLRTDKSMKLRGNLG